MERYEWVRDLGRGAFGVAMLVRDLEPKAGRDSDLCVIKKIDLEQLQTSDKTEALTEVQVLSKLSHPNIVESYGAFLQESVLHIVMEFVDGGDLSGAIRHRREERKEDDEKGFSEDDALIIFAHCVMALKHVHQARILHRDIKSQNIFLMRAGVVKLGDFGIAKVVHNTASQARTTIGTPGYLAPEVCNNLPYNTKADIWSLGVVLFETLALRQPFQAFNIAALVIRILTSAPADLPAGYSEEVCNVVKETLEKDPERRPSAEQLLNLPIVRRRVGSRFEDVLGADRPKSGWLQTRGPRPSSAASVPEAARTEHGVGRQPSSTSVNVVSPSGRRSEQRLGDDDDVTTAAGDGASSHGEATDGADEREDQSWTPPHGQDAVDQLLVTADMHRTQPIEESTPAHRSLSTTRTRLTPSAEEEYRKLVDAEAAEEFKRNRQIAAMARQRVQGSGSSIFGGETSPSSMHPRSTPPPAGRGTPNAAMAYRAPPGSWDPSPTPGAGRGLGNTAGFAYHRPEGASHGTQALAPAPADRVEERDIFLQYRCGQDIDLGLDLDFPRRGVLRVAGVQRGGFIDNWNRRKPASQVRQGDTIVEVNGVRGDALKLHQILTTKDVNFIAVIPTPPGAAAPAPVATPAAPSNMQGGRSALYHAGKAVADVSQSSATGARPSSRPGSRPGSRGRVAGGTPPGTASSRPGSSGKQFSRPGSGGGGSTARASSRPGSGGGGAAVPLRSAGATALGRPTPGPAMGPADASATAASHGSGASSPQEVHLPSLQWASKYANVSLDTPLRLEQEVAPREENLDELLQQINKITQTPKKEKRGELSADSTVAPGSGMDLERTDDWEGAVECTAPPQATQVGMQWNAEDDWEGAVECTMPVGDEALLAATAGVPGDTLSRSAIGAAKGDEDTAALLKASVA